jgi:HK97 gp10 family phage protein
MPQRRTVSTLQKNRALERIERAAMEQCREITEFIAFAANRNAPVDLNRHPSHEGTRRLHNAYQARRDEGSWVVLSNRPYWKFVEFGTHRQQPIPHLRPAIEAARQVYGR